MTRFTHKLFAWIWMSALLAASVGVSVEQVYCYCLGKTSFSLFAADDACQAANLSVDVAYNSSCCSKKKAERIAGCCDKKDSESRGCTHKTTRYHQLKTAFDLTTPGLKKLVLPDFSASANVFPQPNFTFQFAPRQFNAYAFEFRPPPISGRIICVRQGVFRC